MERPPQGPPGSQSGLKPKRRRQRPPPSYYVDEFRGKSFLECSDERRVQLAAEVRKNKFEGVPLEEWTEEQRKYAEWMKSLGDDDQPKY